MMKIFKVMEQPLFLYSKKNDLSWLYLPENYTKAHRIIMTGNFSKLNNGNYDLTATLEFSEKLETETVKKEIKK